MLLLSCSPLRTSHRSTAMASILLTKWTELLRFLNVDNIKSHLLSTHLLTMNEYEKLKIRASYITQQDQVEMLLSFVIQKGSQHEQLFLNALKRSMECESPHLGHKELIVLLEKEMKKKETSFHGFSGQKSNVLLAATPTIVM